MGIARVGYGICSGGYLDCNVCGGFFLCEGGIQSDRQCKVYGISDGFNDWLFPVFNAGCGVPGIFFKTKKGMEAVSHGLLRISLSVFCDDSRVFRRFL